MSRRPSWIPASWSPECWSLRYAKDRWLAAVWRWTHPERPWLTRQAVRILEHNVRGEGRVVEFGSGWSTVWFARRFAHVISVEHDPRWAVRVRSRLQRRGLSERVELRLVNPEQVPAAVADLPEPSVDVLLIDGIRRDECLLASLPLLRVGGILVIDNINRYVPNHSRGPGSLRAWGANPGRWPDLWPRLSTQNSVWTSDGVTDTLVIVDWQGDCWPTAPAGLQFRRSCV